MRLLGFNVSVRKEAPRSLQSVDDSRGWTTIQDFVPGAWQQDVAVDANRVQSNWAVFACKTLIAADIGKLGSKLTEFNKKQGIYEDVESPAASPFLRKPNGYQIWQKFIEYWILSKLSDGNAYILKERDDRGVVIAGYVLDPARVAPLISERGNVFYRLNEDRLAQIRESDVVVPASEIIHDRYWCLFNPLVGVSPLFAAGVAATHGLNMQTQSSTFFRNSAVPSGILVTAQRIDDELAKRYQNRWETNYGGAQRGRTAVLGNGLEYKPITQTAVDSDIVAQQNLSAEMVCSCFHVPPFKIGIGEMPTYQNADVLNQKYYDECLHPLVKSVEDLLDDGLDLPKKGYKAQLDEDDLLRMDKMTQMEFVAKGIEKAIFSPNEGRRRFNMPPVDGGNDPMIQQQNFSLPALAKRDAKDDPFEGAAKPAGTGQAPPPEPPPAKQFDAVSLRLKFGDVLREVA
jgi:HK97 family phage portal protein